MKISRILWLMPGAVFGAAQTVTKANNVPTFLPQDKKLVAQFA